MTGSFYLSKVLHRKLNYAERRIYRQQRNSLPPHQLALHQRRHRHDQHDQARYRKLKRERGVPAKERRSIRKIERCKRDRYAADQDKIEQVGSDDISEGKSTMTLHEGCDRRYQLRKQLQSPERQVLLR